MRNYTYDTVVIGGGMAGIAAAMGAAKMGANTAVIERCSYFGGNATAGGIHAFCGVYTCGENPVKVVGGACDEILAKYTELGGHVKHYLSATGNTNIHLAPELLKYTLDEISSECGIDSFLDARLIKANVENDRIESVICTDDEGEFKITAKTYVDATGHGNLAYLAGAKTIIGDENGKVQAVCMSMRLENVDMNYSYTPSDFEKAVQKAKLAGISNLGREKGFILPTDDNHELTVLIANFMPEKDLSSVSMTKMEKEGRKQAWSYIKAFNQYMPGMQNAKLVLTGPSLSFRESRRLVGRETLTYEDTIARTKNKSAVARGGWKPEIHKSTVASATYINVPAGSWYDITLGMLQSVNMSNLYGAGRFISAEPNAFAAVRVLGTALATGQAAGTAAALQALKGEADIEEVQAELKKQNAIL